MTLLHREEIIEEKGDNAWKGNERRVICIKYVNIEHIPWNVWADIVWFSTKGG